MFYELWLQLFIFCDIAQVDINSLAQLSCQKEVGFFCGYS